MFKADQIFIENMKRLISDESTSDADGMVRPVYEDGTPAHTNYITQVGETYDLDKNEFPITTLRPIAWKSGIKEILWIYQDQTSDLSVLREKYGITWWDPWDCGDGTIGHRYGYIVNKYDLVNKVINGLKKSPFGRRHIIDMWQYTDLAEKAQLDMCAFLTMWSTRGGYLDCTMIIRSSDYLVAGHVNRMQYVALQMMIAKATGFKPGKFHILSQNLHYYDRHRQQLNELLSRTPSEKNPILLFNPKSDNFYEFTIDDFTMKDYEPVKPQLSFELGI